MNGREFGERHGFGGSGGNAPAQRSVSSPQMTMQDKKGKASPEPLDRGHRLCLKAATSGRKGNFAPEGCGLRFQLLKGCAIRLKGRICLPAFKILFPEAILALS